MKIQEHAAAIKAIPQQPQYQGSLNDQLLALRVAADRLGFCDAADFLRRLPPQST